MRIIQITDRFSGAVLYEHETIEKRQRDGLALREALEAACKAGANLADANLAGAYLAGAYLDGANLDGAYLAGAYLAGANLDGADVAKTHGDNVHGKNYAAALAFIDRWAANTAAAEPA